MSNIKVPKGERRTTTYLDTNGNQRFFMTIKDMGGGPNFYLYEVSDGSAKKLGSGKNPLELEEKFKVADVCIGAK